MVCAPISVSAVTDAEVGRRGDLAYTATAELNRVQNGTCPTRAVTTMRHERALCTRQRQEATGPDIPLSPWSRRVSGSPLPLGQHSAPTSL